MHPYRTPCPVPQPEPEPEPEPPAEEGPSGASISALIELGTYWGRWFEQLQTTAEPLSNSAKY